MMVGKIDHDKLHAALIKAGRVADVAGRITGEMLNFKGREALSISVAELYEYLPLLKDAVKDYNQAIMELNNE